MSFVRYNDKGKQIRFKTAVIDCSKDKVIVEQNHKEEVNINNIVKRHGMDIIAKTAALQTPEFTFDELPNNDFQEAMNILTRASDTFDKMPHELRKKFDNDPAVFMDFIHNPDNLEEMRELGMAEKLPEPAAPVEVIVKNPEPVAEPNPETP